MFHLFSFKDESKYEKMVKVVQQLSRTAMTLYIYLNTVCINIQNCLQSQVKSCFLLGEAERRSPGVSSEFRPVQHMFLGVKEHRCWICFTVTKNNSKAQSSQLYFGTYHHVFRVVRLISQLFPKARKQKWFYEIKRSCRKRRRQEQ